MYGNKPTFWWMHLKIWSLSERWWYTLLLQYICMYIAYHIVYSSCWHKEHTCVFWLDSILSELLEGWSSCSNMQLEMQFFVVRKRTSLSVLAILNAPFSFFNCEKTHNTSSNIWPSMRTQDPHLLGTIIAWKPLRVPNHLSFASTRKYLQTFSSDLALNDWIESFSPPPFFLNTALHSESLQWRYSLKFLEKWQEITTFRTILFHDAPAFLGRARLILWCAGDIDVSFSQCLEFRTKNRTRDLFSNFRSIQEIRKSITRHVIMKWRRNWTWKLTCPHSANNIRYWSLHSISPCLPDKKSGKWVSVTMLNH